MSTILKALEKMEEDQRLGRTGGIAEAGSPMQGDAPDEPAAHDGRRLPWRGALVGAAVVTVTLGLAWLWTPQSETEQAVAVPETRQVAAVKPAEPPPPVVSSPPVRNVTPPARRNTLPVREVIPPVQSFTPPAPEPAPLAVASEIQPTADESEPPHREVRVQPAAPAPVRPAPTPAPAPSVASVPPPPRPEPKPAAPRVVSTPPPPTVHVAGTTWHPSSDRRSARVEVEGFSKPLELKEGDAVGVLVVAEIQPSAVVFLHGSTRLRRAVGR